MGKRESQGWEKERVNDGKNGRVKDGEKGEGQGWEDGMGGKKGGY